MKKKTENAVFLIDGNHTFVYCLNEHQEKIDDLKRQMKGSYEKRKKEFKDRYLKIFSKRLGTDRALQVVEKYTRYINIDADRTRIERYEQFKCEDIAPNFTKRLFVAQREFEEIIKSIGISDENKKLNINSFIFDAHLPPIADVIRKLKNELHKNLQKQDIYIEKKLQYHLQNLENKKIEFFTGTGKCVIAPYTTKETYLKFLENDAMIGDQIKLKFGRKYINWNYNSLSMKEKGVDAKLVIQGVESANDPNVDYICLIASDGDFEPLVEYIKSKNKEVILLPMTDQASKPLIRSVNQHVSLTHNYFDLAEIGFNYEGLVNDALSSKKMVEYFDSLNTEDMNSIPTEDEFNALYKTRKYKT